MISGRKRKLINRHSLVQLEARLIIRVPFTKAVEQLKLDISRPTLIKLLDLAQSDDPVVEASMFPAWLDNDASAPPIQEQPDNWKYKGDFPFGEWVEIKV